MAPDPAIKINTRGVNVFYGDKQALFEVDLVIHANRVTSLIGPSGCGKSTFIRCINRMNDVIETCRVEGSLALDGRDVYAGDIDVVKLRARDRATGEEMERIMEDPAREGTAALALQRDLVDSVVVNE